MNTWKQAWTCVNYEPRKNLGVIIDSFNSLAREYADPYSPSGLQRSPASSTAFLKAHLAELAATVPGDKIFLFQIADAGVPEPSSPLSTPPAEDSGIPRLQPWSRNCRLFPLETQRGAFLPVAQYGTAVLSTGYSGDLSLEVFNASLHKNDPHVPAEHASRGYTALTRLDGLIAGKQRSDSLNSESQLTKPRSRIREEGCTEPPCRTRFAYYQAAPGIQERVTSALLRRPALGFRELCVSF